MSSQASISSIIHDGPDLDAAIEKRAAFGISFISQAARYSLVHHHRIAAVTFAAAGMAISFALPASAQTSPPLRDDAVIQTAAPVRAAVGKEAFRSRVHAEMAEWRSMMQAFDEKVETGSERRRDAAEVRLRAAWDDTEVEARNVEIATARGWERSRSAYEAASERMVRAWEAVRF